MGRRFLWLFPIILFSLILVSFAILARPFSREAMATALGDSLASKVVFGHFGGRIFRRPASLLLT
jgi:hypothetical protein